MDVKWIKLSTDIFDNRKIRQIETLPDGDSIIVIWMKLLCLAGNINDSGLVYFTKEIPYTDQMLATQFNRPITTIQLAIKTFQSYGMVDVVDDLLHISNWEKYQSLDRLEELREQNRKRVAMHREKKKSECNVTGNVTSNVTVTQCNAVEVDKSKKEDLEGDKEALYAALCNKYGQDYVNGKIERAKRYPGTSMETIAKWCEEDMKKRKNSFNNFPQRDTDIGEIEKILLTGQA